jgi:hypothetical protein
MMPTVGVADFFTLMSAAVKYLSQPIGKLGFPEHAEATMSDTSGGMSRCAPKISSDSLPSLVGGKVFNCYWTGNAKHAPLPGGCQIGDPPILHTPRLDSAGHATESCQTWYCHAERTPSK